MYQLRENILHGTRSGLLILLYIGFALAGASVVSGDGNHDIPAALTERGDFTTLLSAVESAGLVETLQGEGPFTLFAPTDEAFAKIPSETLNGLLADPDQLAQVLLYHVVSGSVDAATVVTLSSATTVQGQDVSVTVGDGVQVNDSNVIETDVAASNGIIHVIDTVLLPAAAESMPGDLPSELSARGNFTTLLAAVEAAGLVETLQGEGPFTLFAPTDEAFAKIPSETLNGLLADPDQLAQVLLYHIVSGSVDAATVVTLSSATTVQGQDVSVTVGDGVQVNDPNVIETDVAASNGIIHVIDTVLLPAAPEPMPGDLPSELSARGNFTTLLAAVEAAGLVETLQGEGPFTLFAPTDEAFAKIPSETLNGLLADPDQLAQVLLYHVVSGSVDAATVVTLSSATTVQGQDVSVTVGDGVQVNDSNVIETDVAASNGIIHVIDTVLLPAAAEPMPGDLPSELSARGNFTTLLAAVEAAGLVETLQEEGPFTLFAPTDEAFAKIPSETLNGLLADPDQLAQVLLYHVVSGSVDAATVVTLSSATTVQGQDVSVTVGDGVQVNDSNVIETDVVASNGIIHVIDSVLLPASDAEGSLSIKREGNSVVLSWESQEGSGFALESRESLTSGDWSRVEQEPTASESGFSVTVGTEEANAFFRLRQTP